MTRAKRLVLIVDSAGSTKVFGNFFKVVFYSFAKVFSDYKSHFFNILIQHFSNVFYQTVHNGFSGNGNEWLWNSEGMWAQAASTACHRYNDFHAVFINYCFKPLL